MYEPLGNHSTLSNRSQLQTKPLASYATLWSAKL